VHWSSADNPDSMLFGPSDHSAVIAVTLLSYSGPLDHLAAIWRSGSHAMGQATISGYRGTVYDGWGPRGGLLTNFHMFIVRLDKGRTNAIAELNTTDRTSGPQYAAARRVFDTIALTPTDR
jgi:hypothetical protein